MDDEEMAKRKAQWEREEREPTPLPWRVVRGLQWDDKTALVEILGSNEDTVADNAQYYPHAIKEADAELIVRAVNAHDGLVATIARLRAALSRVARWHGEFPETGEFWSDGTPVSYGAQYGSNGERDFMREIARAALEASK